MPASSTHLSAVACSTSETAATSLASTAKAERAVAVRALHLVVHPECKKGTEYRLINKVEKMGVCGKIELMGPLLRLLKLLF